MSVLKSRRRILFKIDDYVYDFGEEVGNEEDDNEEKKRLRKVRKIDRDFVV